MQGHLVVVKGLVFEKSLKITLIISSWVSLLPPGSHDKRIRKVRHTFFYLKRNLSKILRIRSFWNLLNFREIFMERILDRWTLLDKEVKFVFWRSNLMGPNKFSAQIWNVTTYIFYHLRYKYLRKDWLVVTVRPRINWTEDLK